MPCCLFRSWILRKTRIFAVNRAHTFLFSIIVRTVQHSKADDFGFNLCGGALVFGKRSSQAQSDCPTDKGGRSINCLCCDDAQGVWGRHPRKKGCGGISPVKEPQIHHSQKNSRAARGICSKCTNNQKNFCILLSPKNDFTVLTKI